MRITELKIKDRNIPVRTRAQELYVYPKEYKRLGLRFGDTIRIPNESKYPKKWRGEKGIVVERYRAINTKDDGRVFYNPGAEILFLSDDPKKKGKVRRYCNKLNINCRISSNF